MLNGEKEHEYFWGLCRNYSMFRQCNDKLNAVEEVYFYEKEIYDVKDALDNINTIYQHSGYMRLFYW
jgi:hypothetical protein